MKNSEYIEKREKRIAVFGFGKTGRALLDFLLERKLYKTLYLFNDNPVGTPEDRSSKKDYETRGVIFIIGPNRFEQLETMDLILLSPGVDGRTERFHRLRKKGIKIISEIEFASSFIKAPIIAVTGTNGKSTTVCLIHHFLSKNGVDSFLTGNIGAPLISEVERITGSSVVVVEVSSFQLEEIVDFKPYIALILNVTPDHLDRYKNLEDYFDAKLNIGKNQERGDYIILNYDDPLLRENRESMGAARRVWFSRLQSQHQHQQDFEQGACVTDHHIHIKLEEIDEKISLIKNPLRGLHNLENLLASVTAARLMGTAAEGIETSIKDFKGLPHRMESVGKIGDVEFINDSKATNVDATLKSIDSMERSMVLILGGKDKGSDFTILRDSIEKKAEHVLLVGDAASTIFRQLKGIEKKFSFAADFSEAAAKGYKWLENKGGVVLLAPGCASFDMFKNFEHRGEVFKEEVLRLSSKMAGVTNG